MNKCVTFPRNSEFELCARGASPAHIRSNRPAIDTDAASGSGAAPDDRLPRDARQLENQCSAKVVIARVMAKCNKHWKYGCCPPPATCWSTFPLSPPQGKPETQSHTLCLFEDWWALNCLAELHHYGIAVGGIDDFSQLRIYIAMSSCEARSLRFWSPSLLIYSAAPQPLLVGAWYVFILHCIVCPAPM